MKKTLTLGVILLAVAMARSQQPAAEPFEPQTRGPVHEAFAQPYEAEPRPSPIVPKPPPAPIEELPPDQKPAGDNVVWIPGYWAWDDERADFVWVSGFWRDMPPHQAWVPGYWAQLEQGYQWVPGYWSDDRQADQELLPAPPASLDQGPSTPAPNDQASYIPGIWVNRGNQYAWRPGFWLNSQPNWVFTPASYHWTPAGYAFTEGYWDYPLQNRGLLFAPVSFTGSPWNQPGYTYTPSYVVSPASLLSALFVRPLVNHYYFGNYFHPSYAQAGYVPWYDHPIARNVPAPLVSYYRARQGGAWLNELRQQYTQRREGKAPLPPATWQEQRTHNVTVVAPLTQAATELKLHKIEAARLAEERKTAQTLRAAAVHRQEHTTRLVKTERRPEAPPQAKVPLPHVSAIARPPAAAPKAQVPAHPMLPQHEARPQPAARPVAPPHRFDARPAPRPQPEVKHKN